MYITNVRFKSIIEPYTYFCFYTQPSCLRFNVKNGLKVKQLAKHLQH